MLGDPGNMCQADQGGKYGEQIEMICKGTWDKSRRTLSYDSNNGLINISQIPE